MLANAVEQAGRAIRGIMIRQQSLIRQQEAGLLQSDSDGEWVLMSKKEKDSAEKALQHTVLLK